MTRRGQWVVHIVTGILIGVIFALVTAGLSAYLFPDGWPRP